MSALDDLIKIKKQAKTDDLILVLDEVALYQKLSRSKAFQDIKGSKAAQKKLPMLYDAANGSMYALSLLEVAHNVVTHLEDDVPEIFLRLMDGITSKQKKRLEIMQQSVVPISYHSLGEYEHDRMEERVLAVFSAKKKKHSAVLIIIRDGVGYKIFQGYYENRKQEKEPENQRRPYVQEDGGYRLSIKTYSIQGNNAYPFGELAYGDKSYMLPRHDALWIMDKGVVQKEIPLSTEQINALNMAKVDIREFSSFILSTVKEGMAE